MKKYLLTCIVCVCLVQIALAQFTNQGAKINITPGSAVNALDGIVNTSGGTLTVDGTLSTPTDLSNTSGATLQGNGQYFIGGDWTNEATFNAGASTATFDGMQSSAVTSGSNNFYKVRLNKTANNLVLADAIGVENTLDFQAADNYVVLGDYNLQVADLIGYEASRYVRTNGAGFLLRTVGATPVDFPVGNTSYNPAVLTNAGTPDVYLVRVSDAVLSGGATGSPIATDVAGRGWFVEENTPGGSDLSLALQWNGSDEQPTFDRAQAYVSHYIAGSWDSQPTAAASGDDPYTLSRSGITVLSPFAVFDGDFMALIDISGAIFWEHDDVSGVKNATVTLSGDDTDTHLTPLDGTYTLTASNGSNFTVTPTKNINKLNGITVADVTAIQQHVTGISPITSPYKQVAADVNKSNSISTLDASIINQSLLGNPGALNQFKTSWRFVPVDYALSIPPWGFPEKIKLSGVSSNVPGQDFWGVKTGDVVDTYANPANLTATPPLVFQLNDQALRAGDDLVLNFRSSQFDDLAAWQFALRFDPAILEWAGTELGTGSLKLTADHFGLFNISEGEIRSVWSQETGVSPGEAEVLFQLKFKVLQSGGMLRDALHLEETALPALAYTSDLAESTVALHFNQASPTEQAEEPSLLLLSAQPNPFIDQTTIQFHLPEAADVQLRVVDAGGRELWRLNKNYPGGYQQETVRLEDKAGLLFCELITIWGTRTLKLIRVE